MPIAVRPSLRVLWRDPTTLQVGVDPTLAVAVAGVTPALVDLLDGTRERAQVLAAAAQRGVEVAAAARLLDILAGAGVLADPGEGEHPASEAAALGLRRRGGGVARALAARRQARVRVCGGDLLAGPVAAVLTEAGIGRVTVGPAQRGNASDVVVLCAVDDWDEQAALLLTADGVPHCLAAVREGIGTVGPFVRPGRSSCALCHQIARSDLDPAWPRLLAQLTAPGPAPPPACDAVTRTVTAGLAAAQVLAFLDGDPVPAIDATLSVRGPDFTVRRRRWAAHPDCVCGAAPRAGPG